MAYMNIDKPIFPESWLKPIKPGYGTFPWPFARSGTEYREVALGAKNCIRAALKMGYRHLDTAFTYRNQQQIGEVIHESAISREMVFVTSKLHPNNNFYHDAKKKIREAIRVIWNEEPSASNCYLDSFLLHYPGIGIPSEAWRALQEAQIEGVVKHIGVSNFEIYHLKILKRDTGVHPDINQIEFHPWIYSEQMELIEYCKKSGIAIEGYSPLAQAKRLSDKTINKMANYYKTTPSRILLKWCMQHGVKPIVGSRNPIHLKKNAEDYTFDLDKKEMKQLNDLGKVHPLRIATQWNWNPKTASYGGPIRV